MFKSLSRLIGGDPVQKQLESYSDTVEAINALEPGLKALSDEQLQAKTDEFRQRLAGGETLEDLLVEAFAVVREVSVRTIGLRHFDVQLIGGVVLHEGKIAEMKTGEGKTLVATMPIYLNALEGKGVHLVTVNDYLARRDARWMGPVFHFLGMSVGVLQEAARTEGGRKAFLYDPERTSGQEDVHQLQLVDRKQAYAADVIYGTNNEFGFDYLRDNMANSVERRSQREHHFAILDEVDNILIDEARTPLIISGPSHEDPEQYVRMAKVVKGLSAEDYEISERDRNVSLTEIGEDHVERLLGMALRDPDRPEDITPEQARLLGYLEQSLRAEHLFRRNKDYVVQGGRVIIVDEFTGRLMPGRRWSHGLHQAVEAKENVRIRQENVTYATITLQNYFRMYTKLSGMTGTAVTEAEEFNKIYNVDVLPLPTNLEFVAMQPETDLVQVEYRENGDKFLYFARTDDAEQNPVFWVRKDYADVVFRTEEAKFRAISGEILGRHVRGQPLLVGTTSVELSEKLSGRLRAEPLRRLAQVMVLRDVYCIKHDIPEDGRRVRELDFLNEPLEKLNASVLRPLAKELDVSLNPTQAENLARLARILELEPEEHERLGEVLASGIRHNVLNAKKHDEESRIIADAGALGAVTIATNMAGRGVDIKLGGEVAEEVLAAVNRVIRRSGVEDPENLSPEERLAALEGVDQAAIGIYGSEVELFREFMDAGNRVKDAGGLHVLGSERHDARRIDNQLRGRSARQGDPGSSQFFLSLEDELMRLFGGEQVSGLMQRLNIDDAIPIAHNIVNRTIAQAQTRVEGANFDTRKHLLEYDDVLNQQREVFYGQRDRVLSKKDLGEDLEEMLTFEVERHVRTAVEEPGDPWKLLAWLEEIQPTIALQTEAPYPSFMLSLLLDSLSDQAGPEEAKQELGQVARQALEGQHQHLVRAVEEQFGRTIDRLKDQINQRAEFAEMAFEGVMLSAEETGGTVSVRELVQAVENAAGMRMQLDDRALDAIRADPDGFRRRIPDLVEASLGLRIWAGLLQTVERRVGDSLGLEPQLPLPVNWRQAKETLLNALDHTWEKRQEKMLSDVERELEAALARESELDEKTLLRLLVQMSYGQRTFFDRKTHQRRTVSVARLTYPFAAAKLLKTRDAESLMKRVLDHLAGALTSLKQGIGQSQAIRFGANKIEDLEQVWREGLQLALGQEDFEAAVAAGTLSSLPSELEPKVHQALGHVLLTEAYRGLFLSVGDRLWIEYLTQMEALRTAIGLEAYAQRDPLVQYKSRAFDMFQHLLSDIRAGIVSRVFRVQPAGRAQVETAPGARPAQAVPAGEGKEQARPTKSKRKRKRRRKRR
jgi:preprotein translocase subunit SecA